MNRKEAILRIKDHMEHHGIGKYPHLKLKEALDMAIAALSPPNEPLTLEELREMDGEPVWVKQLKGLSVRDTDWAVVEFRLAPDVKHDKIRVWWPGSEDEDTPSEDDYGKTWLAYRRPPEREEKENDVIEITENL